MIWISFILFGIAIFLLFDDEKSKVVNFFPKLKKTQKEDDISVIDISGLLPRASWRSIRRDLHPTIGILGSRAKLIVLFYVIFSVFISYYLIYHFFYIRSMFIMIVSILCLLFFGYFRLKTVRRKTFQRTFPDALNILMSAVTAGESLMQAFIFVGGNMDGEVGREFKLMGDRLRLGENSEDVLKRSCEVFPYPEYIFFTIAIRANLNRGGQLKGVLARLIRVLVDARAMERKKMAMTSEARISAKIVAAIPLCFAIMLNFLNPDNIKFILHDPEGQWILYYVLGSELLGLFIVWLLVKRVKL
ncbi:MULTISPECIES: type II secretion system F family protein [unclassified Vibrio]|uniref:type II secretion system F family protein n=1 Tax=unclassified Vibrio TaxID=2614977 RepID=UPI0018E4CFF6|nr:type II secretion system F family protein [Vibrio sp. 10N.261.54.E10]